MRILATAGLAATLASAIGAQIPTNHIVVLTRTVTPAASVMLDVDPASGLALPVGRFPSDAQAPLAITLDPVNGEPIVALRAGSASQIIRLQLAGHAVVREQTLAILSGTICQLAVDADNDVLALVGGPNGGLVRVPRLGGSPTLVASLPRASAMMAVGGVTLSIAQSGAAGPPVIDPSVVTVDLRTGTPFFGPSILAGFTPRRIEGLVDLVTALPRVALALSDGTIGIHTLSAPGSPGLTQPANVTPVLPAGATTAMKTSSAGAELVALGNIANPFLNQTVVFGGGPPTWNTIAGPLPGDPIDFEFQHDDLARLISYGAGCGTPQPTSVFAATGGRPSLGNTAFSVGMNGGLPSQAVLFTLGRSDRIAFGLPLPLRLPGGCELLASPDLGLPSITSATGVARQPVPIPPQPALLGVTAFGQFFQAQGAQVTTSPGFALRLGN